MRVTTGVEDFKIWRRKGKVEGNYTKIEEKCNTRKLGRRHLNRRDATSRGKKKGCYKVRRMNSKREQLSKEGRSKSCEKQRGKNWIEEKRRDKT